MATERLLTPAEVAEQLQLHPNTVRRFLNEGKIRGKWIGRVWRVEPSAIDEYLAGLEGRPGSVPTEAAEKSNEVSAA
jgi:excisionase family DNA binding protein